MKARNVGHVNRAADHASALALRFQRRRHQRAHRRENDGGIERLRRRLFRAARPHRAERAREVLRRRVALAREGEHAPALPDRDLRQDMGGGAEAVEAERLAFAGHAVAAPADQAGAQPRRDLGIVAAISKRKTKPRVGQHMCRIAAIAGVAGEHRRIAQVLGAAAAIRAYPAGRAQPRHADALTQRKSADARTRSGDAADDLVPRHDRQLGVFQLAVDHMQIGAADLAGRNRDQDFARAGLRHWPLAHDERATRRVQHHGVHARHHSSFQFCGRHPRSKPMRTDTAQPIRLKDYRPPDWLVETVALDVSLHPTQSKVRATLALKPNPQSAAAPLVLDGDGLSLVSLKIDGTALPPESYVATPDSLTISQVPNAPFMLEIETLVDPTANTQLSGLYRSSGTYCTQCEAEGFRRITYFPDRPDVMAVYTPRIEADKTEAPVLLSNGNLIECGDLPGGRHFAVWHDPHPKPSYLFALVGGDLAHVEDRFRTMSGRDVTLRIYVELGKQGRCGYAMDSLKRSMRWDEQAFGREYDLDIFMIVAVSDFDMGAMENKGLNVFNDKYVLASGDTATDADFAHIEAVIAHEYFHNWTGNRITCRAWFPLCLKEGLTVFRDQEFSSDMRSRPVKRISVVRGLRAAQFPEDAGPLAHNVRPEAYHEINNFYTATVYQKGAEVIRMLKALIGAS